MPMTTVKALDLTGYDPDATKQQNVLTFASELEQAAAFFRDIASDLESVNPTHLKASMNSLEYLLGDAHEYLESVNLLWDGRKLAN
jgi:hypothetical protein